MSAIKDISNTKESLIESAEEKFLSKRVPIGKVLEQLDEIYYDALSDKYAYPAFDWECSLQPAFQAGIKLAREQLEVYLKEKYGK